MNGLVLGGYYLLIALRLSSIFSIGGIVKLVPHRAVREREARSGSGVEFSRALRHMLVLAGTRSAFAWCYEPV